MVLDFLILAFLVNHTRHVLTIEITKNSHLNLVSTVSNLAKEDSKQDRGVNRAVKLEVSPDNKGVNRDSLVNITNNLNNQGKVQKFSV